MIVNIYRLTEGNGDVLNHKVEFEKLVFDHVYAVMEKVGYEDIYAWTIPEAYEYACEGLCVHKYDSSIFWRGAYAGGIYVDNLTVAEASIEEQFHEALKDALVEKIKEVENER